MGLSGASEEPSLCERFLATNFCFLAAIGENLNLCILQKKIIFIFVNFYYSKFHIIGYYLSYIDLFIYYYMYIWSVYVYVYMFIFMHTCFVHVLIYTYSST